MGNQRVYFHESHWCEGCITVLGEYVKHDLVFFIWKIIFACPMGKMCMKLKHRFHQQILFTCKLRLKFHVLTVGELYWPSHLYSPVFCLGYFLNDEWCSSSSTILSPPPYAKNGNIFMERNYKVIYLSLILPKDSLLLEICWELHDSLWKKKPWKSVTCTKW